MSDYETFVDDTSTDHSGDLFNKQEIAELQKKDGSIMGGILSIRYFLDICRFFHITLFEPENPREKCPEQKESWKKKKLPKES